MICEQEIRWNKLTEKDPVYQDMLAQCEKAELEYLRIIQKLPEEDRRKLEHYICLCEELEYRRTCLAWEL